MQTLRRPSPLALLAVLLLAGCWTSAHHGDLIDQRLRGLEADDHDHQDAIAAQRQKLDAQLPRVDEKIQQMTETLDKLNRVAHRTGADAEVRLDDMQEKMQQLRGDLEETRHRIDLLTQALQQSSVETDQKLAAVLGPQAMAEVAAKEKAMKLAPADRPGLFATAFTQYKEGDLQVSRDLFLEYLRRYPSDPQAGEAQYYAADALFQGGQLKQAALSFQKVPDKYPRSTRVCDARLKLGLSLLGLKMGEDARAAFEETLRRCGGKVAIAKIAKAKLAELAHPSPAHHPRRASGR